MTEKAKKKPSHTAYVVTVKGDKANWRVIATVWLHGDGEGFDLSLHAVPLEWSQCAGTASQSPPVKASGRGRSNPAFFNDLKITN